MEEFVAIKEETFCKITIYGIGPLISKKGNMFRIKVESGNIVLTDKAVPLKYWAEYVDERDAEVVRCKQ